MSILGNPVGAAVPVNKMLPLDGSKPMTGPLNMNGNKIIGWPDAVSMDTAAVTLTAAGWSGNTQTVAVEGVTADTQKNAVITTAVAASADMYLDCGVKCSVQGAGTLTFICEEVPGADIAVNVLILTQGG